MGTTKQLLELDGKPLVRWVAEAACASVLDEVVIVVGSDAQAVRRAVEGLPLRAVENKQWRDGQSSSVRCAIQALAPDCRAVLFLLADQPLVDSALIDRLVETYRSAGCALLAPAYQGRRGNPVLIDLQRYRRSLLELCGDQGARGLLNAERDQLLLVEVDDATLFNDVDTPEEFARMTEIWRCKRKVGNAE